MKRNEGVIVEREKETQKGSKKRKRRGKKANFLTTTYKMLQVS